MTGKSRKYLVCAFFPFSFNSCFIITAPKPSIVRGVSAAVPAVVGAGLYEIKSLLLWVKWSDAPESIIQYSFKPRVVLHLLQPLVQVHNNLLGTWCPLLKNSGTANVHSESELVAHCNASKGETYPEGSSPWMRSCIWEMPPQSLKRVGSSSSMRFSLPSDTQGVRARPDLTSMASSATLWARYPGDSECEGSVCAGASAGWGVGALTGATPGLKQGWFDAIIAGGGGASRRIRGSRDGSAATGGAGIASSIPKSVGLGRDE